MSADAGFEIIERSLVAETPYVRLEEVSLRGPAGDVAARTVVRVGGAVGLVAVDGDEVVLIRQYRTALDRAVLEIPAGKLDVPGEDPEQCARRELAEEVGLAPGRLEQIVHYYTSPGFTDEDILIYLATDLTPVAMNPIGPEEKAAEVVRVPVGEVAGLLSSIEDSKTVIGLQALLLRRAGLLGDS
jgi:8-oxo-dGTP pyrophosphatase MutT (NUDIX family)